MSAGHEPFAGSLAPTPTLSDAPMATDLMPELCVAVAGAPLGEAVGPRVGEGWLAGAAEQAVTNAAQITLRTARSRLFIGTIVLPTRTGVRQRTRGCVVSTGQADGPPRAEERRSSSLIRTAGRQLPTLLTLSLPSQ